MAWTGLSCRFADNELLGTAAFSDQLLKLLSEGQVKTWYGTTCVPYESDSAYQLGSHFGDAASMTVSMYEVEIGGGGAILGVAGAPETGGSSLVGTAAGGVLAAHGASVGVTVLVKNLEGVGQQVMTLAWGRGGSGGRDPAIKPGTEYKETVRSVNPYDAYGQARDKAIKNAGMGDKGVDYRSTTGPKEGQIVGRQSPDGNHGWRLDWSQFEGFHIHWWDWSQGKGASGYSGTIIVEGATYDTYLDILSHWPQ